MSAIDYKLCTFWWHVVYFQFLALFFLCNQVKLFAANQSRCFTFGILFYLVFNWKINQKSLWFLTPSLRLALLNEAKEVRAAGLRALRYLIRDTSVLQKVLGLQVDYLIARWDRALATAVKENCSLLGFLCFGSKNIPLKCSASVTPSFYMLFSTGWPWWKRTGHDWLCIVLDALTYSRAMRGREPRLWDLSER